MSSQGEKIRVVIRVKPEFGPPPPPLWKFDNTRIAPVNPGTNMSSQPMLFDRIFQPASTNQDIYREFASSIVKECLVGINCLFLPFVFIHF